MVGICQKFYHLVLRVPVFLAQAVPSHRLQRLSNFFEETGWGKLPRFPTGQWKVVLFRRFRPIGLVSAQALFVSVRYESQVQVLSWAMNSRSRICWSCHFS